MIRAIGSILLLVTSTALGLGAANTLKEHVRELEEIIFSLKTIELELSGRRTPLPELLQMLTTRTHGHVNIFYTLCESRLHKPVGTPFHEIWKEAASAAELHINERETILLCEVGNILGRYDADSQCKALQAARERFRIFLEEATEQNDRMGRVYGTLGVAAGALMMIVLI